MSITDTFSVNEVDFITYVNEIQKLSQNSNANEETFYPAFEKLLNLYFKRENFEVLAVPKSNSRNKPDFIVYMDEIPIINIEAKKPDDPIPKWLKANSDSRLFNQLYRYRGKDKENRPVMVTDFKNIWIIDKESPNSLHTDHQIKYEFKLIDDSKHKWKPNDNWHTNLSKSLNYLTEEIIFTIDKVSSMIEHLVKYAIKLKKKLDQILNHPENRTEEKTQRYLIDLRSDFLNSIFSADKTEKELEFIDIYSQTVIYSCFVAWMNFCKEGKNPKNFTSQITTEYLPWGTFAYRLFSKMWMFLTPEIKENIIDKIDTIFQSTKFEKITENTETLITTFYAKFLKEYNPKMAKDRGVVYTPQPVVNFIIKGIDILLKKHFNFKSGLITENQDNQKISFLDPASGTMGFACETIRVAHNLYKNKFVNKPVFAEKKFQIWIRHSFLPNFYSFEILMAPFLLGNLRLTMVLNEENYSFNRDSDEINSFLFNTLMDKIDINKFQDKNLYEELKKGENVRNKEKVLVVLGNPPYSKHTENKFDWIESKINFLKKHFSLNEKDQIKKIKTKQKEKLRGFHQNQKKLKMVETEQDITEEKIRAKTKQKIEKTIYRFKKQRNDYVWDIQKPGTKPITNFQGLHNDYVKFIRFAQWKIAKNGYGIVGYIVENSFLYKMQFRGMRSSLLRDFDKIYIIDLHGNIKENISIPKKQIDQGIKVDENIFGNDTQVGVAIIFLIRTKKHSNTHCNVNYTEIWGRTKEKLAYLDQSLMNIDFEDVPINNDYSFRPQKKIQKGYNYSQFIYLYDLFKESNSGITTGNNRLFSNIKLKDLSTNVEEEFNINNSKKLEKKIIQWNFRGFDIRYLYYHPPKLERHRFEIMQYLIGKNSGNKALILTRQQPKGDYSSALVIDKPFYIKCFGTGGVTYGFPLKINENDKKINFDYPLKPLHSNINKNILGDYDYISEISDNEIFNYIYAILWTPIYRKRYNIKLKKDYPRIPFPREKKMFDKIMKKGQKLIDLHLFNDPSISTEHFTMNSSTDYVIHYIRRNDKDHSNKQIPDTYDPETQKIYFKKRTKSQIKNEKQGDKLNNITWIGNITQKIWDFHLGEKQQLKEWLYARKGQSLSTLELEYFLKMCDVIRQTLEVQNTLDPLYITLDPETNEQQEE